MRELDPAQLELLVVEALAETAPRCPCRKVVIDEERGSRIRHRPSFPPPRDRRGRARARAPGPANRGRGDPEDEETLSPEWPRPFLSSPIVAWGKAAVWSGDVAQHAGEIARGGIAVDDAPLGIGECPARCPKRSRARVFATQAWPPRIVSTTGWSGAARSSSWRRFGPSGAPSQAIGLDVLAPDPRAGRSPSPRVPSPGRGAPPPSA
jgi:hypothetical protein